MRALALGFSVFVCLVFSGDASAQPREYKGLVEEAIAEFGAGRWEEARALFQEAHDARPSARTQRGLGMVAYELRKYADSLQLLRAALVDERDPLTPELRVRTEELVARAEAFVGRYRVELGPEGATITVDGREPQLDPDGILLLDAGDRQVTVRAEGYREQTRTLDVRGRDDKALRIVLVSEQPQVPADAISPATVAASSQPAPSAPRPTATADDSDGGGLLSKWWFWTVAGAVVAAAVIGVVALAPGEDEVGSPTVADNDIVIMALEAQ